MSDEGVLVTAVREVDGQEVIQGQAGYDNQREALLAVKVLLEMFAWDDERHRIEVTQS